MNDKTYWLAFYGGLVAGSLMLLKTSILDDLIKRSTTPNLWDMLFGVIVVSVGAATIFWPEIWGKWRQPRDINHEFTFKHHAAIFKRAVSFLFGAASAMACGELIGMWFL